ncbi:helix-turn-helix domain-containing protein [Alteraurantiacibacter palmitatis]|uniref:Helix-turn-helix domain-containing protein n=1 Tax=Alteraurantiacibacter palmitatis TaxID=2054628 RepID=A0ABV7E8H5_9SPHN
MGWRMMQAAQEALEAAPPIGKRKACAAKGSLSPSARLALVCLANAARDETGLAWPSQATIASFVGCSVNTIGSALADLAAAKAAGHLSAMPNRAGRVPLYLVHPGGMARYQPVPAQAVRSHLAAGRFSEGEREEALAWLAGLGHIEGPAGAAIIRASAVKSLRRRDKTPQAIGEVPAAHPPSHCALPPQPLRHTPQAIGDEPSKETEKETESGCDPRAAGEPAESEAEALREGAGGKGALRASGGALDDWRDIERADPQDVLRCLLAADDARAARLAGMSEAEALAAVADMQRTLGAFRAG